MSQPKIIKLLSNIIQIDPNIKIDLLQSIQNADIKNINDYASFIDFVANSLVYYPQNAEILDQQEKKFYYIITRKDTLQQNKLFKKWVHRYTELYGNFMDSPRSTIYLQKFCADPKFRIQDYYQPASGWMSFNQFFARKLKPGKRPIDQLCNDDIIVSPCDATFSNWHVIRNARVQAKGVEFRIQDLLSSSEYGAYFADGLYCFMHLKLHDYHWYHTPVAGNILEKKFIPGDVDLDIVKAPNGDLKVVNGEKIHVQQQRGLLVLDTNNGLVAVVCVGVGHVSSVNILPDVNDYLYKGQEFGYFAYGGSDIIVLFSNPNIVFVAKDNTKYRQGQQIAYFNKKY